jgi:glycosyltransferase involved in cell wall biosynthesis
MSEPNSPESTLDITVAIPAYNGAKRIPLVLDRLKKQIKTEDLRWEVIVVDNNSQDNTAEVIKQCQTQWPDEVSLRYCFEPRQGAAFARQTAVKEAKGELVGFLDDDNLPEENWLSEAVDFSHRHPHAGAFSGRIYGCYEVSPPEGFEKIKAFLAIRDHGSQVILFEPENLKLPPAASLIVRKNTWLNHVPEQPVLTGKIPGLFIQGDDYEPLIYMYKASWQIVYNPELKTYHQIPKERFNKSYLLTLARGCGLATYHLKCIKSSPQESAIIFMRILVGNLRRIIVHYFKYRHRIKNELEIGMFWEFYWGSFLSPFIKLNLKKQ